MNQDLTSTHLTLVIGNKNYSSWSLRAWLMLKHFNLAFEEIRVVLSQPGTEAELAKWSPSAKVPVLLHGDLRVWDSLAIGEYLSEVFLAGAGWPRDRNARALARSMSAEMHAGFASLRTEMPMNCRRTPAPIAASAACLQDIRRIEEIWTQCRTAHGQTGPWLFGEFSMADCMYAPVVLRFSRYGVELGDVAQGYVAEMLKHPALQAWVEAGSAETEIIPGDEI